MPVYKDEKRKTWYSSFYYKDVDNNSRKKTKRGFSTKREAVKWEEDFKIRKSRSLHKTFAEFWNNYEEDVRPKIRASSWDTKEHIVRTKIMPFFSDMSMDEIKSRDIIRWQNEIIQLKMEDGREYSAVYYKTVQSQLSAIFNHAVRYYDLNANPVKSVLPITGGRRQEFKYWTEDEFSNFSQTLDKTTIFYFAFQILYWCGLREGELLALTGEDFDFEEGAINIDKTFSVVKGIPVVSRPKTPNGYRTVLIPMSLNIELRKYVGEQNFIGKDRIFDISKTRLSNEFKKGIEIAGLKRIRIHDLRHSHVSLLIHMGYSAVAIGERVGHKSERITYYYAHLFPGVQENLVKGLDVRRNAQ